uniref:Fatty Acid Transport Protein-2 n=1 Tax=Plutella xylostella TaxID=51655 RepID=A0A1L8D6D2_PLUXY
MASKAGVRFEEAEKKRTKILAWTGLTFASIGWLFRSSPTAVTLVAALSAYLMSGDRYQWVYIWRKTVYRDML